jgi:hypothetical protein
VATVAPLIRRGFSKWAAWCGRRRTSGWRSPRGSLHLLKNSDQDFEEFNCCVERAMRRRSSSFWDRRVAGFQSLSRGKAPVGKGTGVGPRTHQETGPRSHWNVAGCAGARDTQWSHSGAARRCPVGALRGPVPRPTNLVVRRRRTNTGTITGTSRRVLRSGVVRNWGKGLWSPRWAPQRASQTSQGGTRTGRREDVGT